MKLSYLYFRLLSFGLLSFSVYASDSVDVISHLEVVNGLSAQQKQSLTNNLKEIDDYYDSIKKVSHQQIEVTPGAKPQVFKGDDSATQQQPVVQTVRAVKRSKNSAAYRDPFAITARMFGYRAPKDVGYDFSPVLDVKVPDIQLKAVMRGPNGQLAALIDVDGQGSVVVREGDTIGLDAGQATHGLRIKKINRSSLVLTTGSLGGDVIVR